MGKSYKQLSMEERCLIQTQLSMCWSPAAIAGGLRRARSTIAREMARNRWKPDPPGILRDRPPVAGGYDAPRAHRRAQLPHLKPRVARMLVPGNPLWISVLQLLLQGLSPEQIASTLAHMPNPVQLSHETIYTAHYAMPKGQLRARVLTLLRRSHKQRRARSGRVTRPFIDALTLIDERPSEVTERLVSGHWEGDLIKGKVNQSRVGALVERTTLFVALVKLEDGRAETTANGFAAILNRFQSQMRRSLTYDQGREMTQHRSLAKQANIKVYFAHPHSPWERGFNENTNGLLRQYLPKEENLSLYSQDQLDDIAFTKRQDPKIPRLESPTSTLPPRRHLQLPKLLAR